MKYLNATNSASFSLLLRVLHRPCWPDLTCELKTLHINTAGVH